MNVTAIVLAGGMNTRLGQVKALVDIGGKTLLQRTIERVKPLAEHIVIVSSAERAAIMTYPGAETVIDTQPGKGPLIGIYTGLIASQTPYSVAVACDMPFLSTTLLGHMVDIAPGYDAVVPRFAADRIEPLHAVYSRDCVGLLEKWQINVGSRLWVNLFLATANVRYFETDEIKTLDPNLLSFFNINFPADLARAQDIANRMDGK